MSNTDSGVTLSNIEVFEDEATGEPCPICKDNVYFMAKRVSAQLRVRLVNDAGEINEINILNGICSSCAQCVEDALQ